LCIEDRAKTMSHLSGFIALQAATFRGSQQFRQPVQFHQQLTVAETEFQPIRAVIG
jgi:hypothetical protein